MSNSVRVVAEERDDVSVEGTANSTFEGDTTTVTEVAGRIVARVPTGTDVIVGSDSGSVKVEGKVGATAVTTSSARIEIDSASSVDARTSSGRVVVGTVTGTVRIRAVSGRVEVAASGGADVASTSGRIVLRDVDGVVDAHCVSGRIEIEMAAPHDVEAETISGRVNITLPAGTRVHMRDGLQDLTPAPPDCDCTVSASSLSGRVEVVT